MPNTPARQLGVFVPTGAPGLLFTPPGGLLRAVLTTILISNTDTIDHPVTLFHTAGADTPDKEIFPGAVVKANSVVAMGRGIDMEPGDKIDGITDLASKVNVAFYYIAVT